MVNTGEANGLTPTTAFLTHMDEPIGCAVGNWLEVKECIDVMNGKFTALNRRDLVTLTVIQAGQMLLQSGLFPDKSLDQLTQKALGALKDGTALAKFREMVIAQGGDCSVVDDPASYPFAATHTTTVLAVQDGHVALIDALVIGQLSVLLGAGRKVTGDPVDPCAGILLHVKVGNKVLTGDVIAQVYTNLDGDILQTAVARINKCIQYSDQPITVPPIVSHRVTKEKGMEAIAIPALEFDEDQSPQHLSML
jgi:pyrimidine-nucleoside phosphorylase